jgi:hypothetical protein
LATCDLDNKLADWAKNCLLLYIYNTVSLGERFEEVFSDHYHAYTNVWVATTWNYYRSARILVSQLLFRQLSYLRYYQQDDLALVSRDPLSYKSCILSAKSNLLQMIYNICASVPFLLGIPNTANSTVYLPRTVGGNPILWLLYTALCTDIVSDIIYKQALGRLKHVADIIGIRQAAPVGYILSIGKEVSVGEVGDHDTQVGALSNDCVESLLDSLSGPMLHAPIDSCCEDQRNIPCYDPICNLSDTAVQGLSNLPLDIPIYVLLEDGLNLFL